MAENKNKPVRRTFHYKVAKFKVDGKTSLQSRLKLAFKEKPKAMSRRQEIRYGGETSYRWVNHLKDVGVLTCGVLISYKEGVLPSAITLDEDAEELVLEEVVPDKTDQVKRREFLEGLLYFGVYQNYVIFMGSVHLLSQHFEEHLQWLLQKLTKTIGKDEALMIADNLSPDYRNIKYSKVKELLIKSNIQITEDKESQEISDRKFKPVGAWWNAITKILNDGYGLDTPDPDFKGGLRTEDLSVTLSVKLTNARGRANLNTPIIDPLANSFRHMDNPPIELHFMSGEVLKTSSARG